MTGICTGSSGRHDMVDSSHKTEIAALFLL